MSVRRLCSPVVLALAVTVAGAAVAGAPPVFGPASPAGVTLLDTEAWGMGGSGDPIPSQQLIDGIRARFGNPDPPFFDGQPIFHVDSVHPLFTPEGMYPVTGVKSLPFDESAAQGVTILDHTIHDRIAAGHDLVIAGGSQSATIASLEMRDLLALPADQQPTAEQLSFVLLVDPSNPNGGLLERFGDPSLPPLSIPGLGITFSGATPADTPWDTAIYNMEYDGFSDFPSYPLNLLSDINAGLGIVFVHSSIEHLSDEELAATVRLPVSADYTGHTDYFMVPHEDLPLLEPLRLIPVVGNPLADLLQPDLKVLVNLGYGNIDHGWDPGPADVPTPMGLFPDLDWGEVLTALGNGAQQGIHDFIGDIEDLVAHAGSAAGGGVELPSLADLPSLTDVVNTLSSAAASAYAALLPLADVANAFLTSLPAYEVSLFTQELLSGHLVEAIGLPIAAGFGLGTIAAGFAVAPIANAVTEITADFQHLFPS